MISITWKGSKYSALNTPVLSTCGRDTCLSGVGVLLVGEPGKSGLAGPTDDNNNIYNKNTTLAKWKC